jgi:DNA (cytosine-5)-methyltransferase 1
VAELLTVGSLFSGIEGIGLGLERAGMTVSFQVEADPTCRKVLNRHWPDVPVYDDVRTVHGAGSCRQSQPSDRWASDAHHPGRGGARGDTATDLGRPSCERCLPRVDVLCGGFPCQDLSVAGGRAGLAGERSGLFHQFMRLADEIAPRWVVIENVPGLLSSQCGRDMGVVLGTLADLGYGWCYRVLDAQYFRVAQRRRRVFIVGCAGGPARAAQVLLEPESCDGDSPPSRSEGPGVATGVAACLNSGGNAGGFRTEPGEHLIPAVAFHQTQEPITGDDFAPALGATSIGMGVAYAFAENQRGEVLETDYSHQLTTGGGKPGQGYPAVRQGMAVRRLTPLECERLQGFPDGWTEGVPDSSRYRMLGNAVCVPVAEWIGRRIVAAA